MKYLALLTLLLAAACTIQPVTDTRTEPERAATRVALTALPRPPLPGVIRVRIVPPPTPTVSLLPTVTPTPEGK